MELEAELRAAWMNFLDANPDDLTSPADLPDHALMTCDQFVAYASGSASNTIATLRADNERLGRERDADIDALHGTFSKPIAVLQERVAAAEAERDTLLAQVAKMRGALEPFAAAAEHFDCHVKDGDVVPISLRHIRARHVFAARAALTKEPS